MSARSSIRSSARQSFFWDRKLRCNKMKRLYFPWCLEHPWPSFLFCDVSLRDPRARNPRRISAQVALVGAAAPDSWWEIVTSGTYASSPAGVTHAKECAQTAIRHIDVSSDVALQDAPGPPLCWPRRRSRDRLRQSSLENSSREQRTVLSFVIIAVHFYVLS